MGEPSRNEVKEEAPPKLVAMLACMTWVNCWMFVPFVGFGSIWYRFSIKHAVSWWVLVGLLAPKLSQKDPVRKFIYGMKYWIDGSETVGTFDGLPKPRLELHHPHGAVAINAAAMGAKFLDSPAVAAPPVFKMPVTRQLMEMMGAISSEKAEFTRNMRSKRNIAMLPGGVEEVTLSDQHTERLYLKKRRGFVKYSLQYGYDLVPIYHIGETQLFDAFWPSYQEWNVRIRLWIAQKTGIALVFGIGCRFMFNIPKMNQKCISCIGERLVLPTIENPTPEDVAKYHKLYMERVEQLYNANRNRVAGYEKKELVIW